jgi:hypothetical protein
MAYVESIPLITCWPFQDSAVSDIKSRLEKVKAYCRQMASAYLMADAKLAMLKPLAYDRKFVKRFDRSVGAHGLNLLRTTLLLDIIEDLVGFTQDDGQTSASLVNIRKLISAIELREAIKEDFCKPPPSTWVDTDLDDATRQQIEEDENRKYREEQAHKFDQLYQSITTGIDNLINSDTAKELKRVRNKVSSHYAMTSQGKEPRLLNPADFGLKWGDAEQYSKGARNVVFDMVLLVANSSYALDSFEQHHTRIADDFWRVTTEKA